jgi:SAM-dependent methyltransferase
LARVSTKKDWESYWSSKARVEDVYSNKDRIARNLEITGLPHHASVLEVGAGTGRDSLPLAAAGATVIRLDYSIESLRLLTRKPDVGTLFTVGGDTFRLPFRDNIFDVVFHQGLLEHFRRSDADRMMREQIRVLKQGGLLLIDVPQRYHPYTVLKHILIALGKWFAGWERSFSYPELNRLMMSHGVHPVHAYGEWMVPSLPYRVIREAGKWIGIRLPLYPAGIPVVKSIRHTIRTRLLKTRLPLYTGISIGIVGRKK